MSDDERARLATRLRELREYCGYSQQSVANVLGISRPAVSLIESGERKVDAVELKRLAVLYQTDPTSLMAPEEVETPSTFVALARAAADLTEEDQNEVLRFANFLLHKGRNSNEQA